MKLFFGKGSGKEEAQHGGQGHKAVHSRHGFGHFFTTWRVFLVYLTKPIIQDSTKPINQGKFDKTFILKCHKYMQF